jgi:hypothetical protein
MIFPQLGKMIIRAAIGIGLAVVVLTAGLVCPAQEVPRLQPREEAQKPAGSIFGTVYCADTNAPARLAEIFLVQYSEKNFWSWGAGTTDLDGRFAAKQIPEGDYYVIATLPGYANLTGVMTKEHLDSLPEEDRKKLLATVAKGSVAANQSTQVAVRLERSVEIDGTVLYDDGSPAPGLRVSYKLKDPGAKSGEFAEWNMRSTMSGPLETDDQGRFRILGVAPGEYLVRVTVPTESSLQENVSPFPHFMGSLSEGLTVYVGGAFRLGKAETIKVDAAGAAKTADITVPLSKLHSILGQVLLKSTGQPPVGANLKLLYADTKEEARSVYAPNGRFEIDYVPEGSYVLRAAAGATAPPDMSSSAMNDGKFHHVVWNYPDAGDGSPEKLLEVTGDVDNVTILVPDPGPIKERGAGTVEFNWGSPSAESSQDQSH